MKITAVKSPAVSPQQGLTDIFAIKSSHPSSPAHVIYGFQPYFCGQFPLLPEIQEEGRNHEQNHNHWGGGGGDIRKPRLQRGDHDRKTTTAAGLVGGTTKNRNHKGRGRVEGKHFKIKITAGKDSVRPRQKA